MATIYGKTSGGDTAIYNSPGTMYWQCYVSYTSTSATLYLYVGSSSSGHLYVNIDSYIGSTDFANYTNTYMASGETYTLGTISINPGESYSFSATCKSGTWGQNGTLSGTIPRQAYAPSYNSINSSNVTSSSVVLTASVNANGASITGGGWQLSTNGGSTWTTYSGDYASKTITGLTHATTYTYRGYATNSIGTTYSTTSTFTTSAVAPSYTATSSSSVTATSVTLSATIDNGGATITAGGWQLSTNGGSTWTTYSGNWTSKTITGLSNSTTYTYRGYATNSVSTTYSSTSTFTTLGPPTYDSTPYTSNLTYNSVQLNVTTINNHGSAITGGGWMLSTNSGSTWTDYPAAGTSSDSCWKKTIYSLSPATTYQYKGYATNGVGTSYSSVGGFTTKAAPPTLASPSITNITATSANLSITCTNTGGKPLTSSNIKVYTVSPFTLVATINGLSGTVTGLSPNTEYRAEANAANADNSKSYGMGTFTTLAPASNIKVSLNGAAFVTGTLKLSQNGGNFTTIQGSKVKVSINGGAFQ